MTTANGNPIPLSQVAKISVVDGPAEIRSENGRLTGYVYIDLADRDIGGYVQRADQTIAAKLKLPPGHAITWTGQYIEMERAKAMTMAVIVAGLLPILLSDAAGSDVMKRIAAPLAGGMVTAPPLSLFIIPVIYVLLYGRGLPPPSSKST